jgi:type III pantothenate kinase
MTPDVVVDVGNSRIKWGHCSRAAVAAVASLPPDDPAAWQQQAERWRLPAPATWVVTGVHPARRARLEEWLRTRGDGVVVIDDPGQLPLRVPLDRPDHVGIDRLFDAVAANSRRPAGSPAVVVDAGSAVTVDYLDETGAFAGGAILPGLRLMAKALHDYTALLPLVEVPRRVPAWPGTATAPAVEAGIFWAVVGGVRALLGQCQARALAPPPVFLTGGDAPILHGPLGPQVRHWPTLTLEGILLTARVL